MPERIPANDRIAMMDLNQQWTLLIGWLPREGELSSVDAKTLVQEQWDKTRAAYAAIGKQGV